MPHRTNCLPLHAQVKSIILRCAEETLRATAKPSNTSARKENYNKMKSKNPSQPVFEQKSF